MRLNIAIKGKSLQLMSIILITITVINSYFPRLQILLNPKSTVDTHKYNNKRQLQREHRETGRGKHKGGKQGSGTATNTL